MAEVTEVTETPQDTPPAVTFQPSPPARSGSKITLQFGLVTIPIEILSAVDEDQGKIKRGERHAVGDALNPVGYRRYDKETGEEVAMSDIVKAYDTETHGEVLLSDDEIASVLGEENGNATIIGIYPYWEFGRYHVSGNFIARPQRLRVGTKTKHPYDRPFVLFLTALESAFEDGGFALIRYTSRGKPHMGALFWNGEFYELHWANEVRAIPPVPSVALTDDEVAAAELLTDMLKSKDAPLPMNDSLGKVRAYALAKATDGATAEPSQVEERPQGDDMLSALLDSIARASEAKVAKAKTDG